MTEFSHCKTGNFAIAIALALAALGVSGQTPKLVVQAGLAAPAEVIAFSPDGRFIATSDQVLIIVWEASTGRQIRTFSATAFGASMLAFDPTSRYLAVYGGDYFKSDFDGLRVFDLLRDRTIWTKWIEKENIHGLRFTPNGRGLMTESGEKRQYTYATLTGAKSLTPPRALSAVSGDARTKVGAAGMDLVLSFPPGKAPFTIPGAAKGAQSLSLNADGSVLGIGRDNEVEFWNTVERRKIASWQISALRQNLRDAGGDVSGLFDSRFGDTPGRFVGVRLSPNGHIFELSIYVPVGTFSQHVQYFNTETGQPFAAVGSGDTAKTTPEGAARDSSWTKFAVSECAPGNTACVIDVWDAATRKKLVTLKGYSRGPVTHVDFLNDSSLVTIDDYYYRIWSASVVDLDAEILAVSPDGSLVANGCEIESADLAADWSRLGVPADACSQGDSTEYKEYPDIVTLRDLKSGKLVHKLLGHTHQVVSGAFNFDGTLLATTDGQGTLDLWDVRSGTMTRSFPVTADTVSFFPNSSVIAFDYGLLNTATGEVTETEYEKNGGESGDELDTEKDDRFSFSSDGKSIAHLVGRCLNGDSYSLKLSNIRDSLDWDFGRSDSSQVASVAFAPDGNSIAIGHGGCTVTSDFSVGILDVRTRKALAFIGHNATVNSVRISPNGKLLLSGSSDGTAKLWSLRDRRLLATLFSLGDHDWVVLGADGRFDTNKALDNIEGLYWLHPDKPLTPVSLDLFMRQYYEPGLLPRLVKCSQAGDCSKEFKPLPPLDKLNRVQPKIDAPTTVSQR